MKIKRILRSGLAILCSVSLVLGNFAMLAPTVNAAETLSTSLEELTPEMLGIADATATTEGITTTTPAESVETYNLDETKFSANVKFDSAAWSSVTYLYNETGRGQLQLAVSPAASSSLLVYNRRLDGETTMYVGDKHEIGVNIEESYTKIVANSDSSFHKILGNPTFGFLGNEFVLSVTTEFIDFDGDGNTNDLEIGIWVNGDAFAPTYCYFKDYEETTFQGILKTENLKAISSPDITNPATPIAPPADPIVYDELTPEMLGIADATATTEGITTSTPTESVNTYNLDETKLSANVKYDSTTESSVTYLYNAAGRGQLKFAVVPAASSSLLVYNRRLDGENPTLYVGDKYETGVNVEESYTKILANNEGSFYRILGGTTFNFLGNEFLLSITTEFMDFDSDGNADDLEIGIWVNGETFAPTYCYYIDYTETTFQGILATKNLKAIASPDVTNPATPVEPPEDPIVYDELTPEMLGIADATATTEGITTSTPTEDVKTYNLDETKFSANVKYNSTTESSVTYLYNAAGRGQLKFAVVPAASSSLLVYNCRLDGDDTTLYVGNKYETGANIEESYTKIVANSDSSFHKILGNPTFSFLGNEFLLSVTTEFVDFDGDGNEDDLEIGIWINGDTYEPTYCYFKDYEETTFQGILKTENLKAISSPDITNPATPVEPTTPPEPTDPDENEPKEETLPTDFTKVAPNFFDIDDFKDNVEDPITYQNTKTPFTSADKVMLYADVVFGSGRTIEYLYNGTTGSGIYLWAKDNLHVRNYMSPSDSVGMYIGGEFVNGEYKGGNLISGRHDNYVIKASEYSTTENFDTLKVSLILTTEFVDFDGEGTANDLKLGVWIKGKLYDNTYIYMRNCLDEYTPALKMNVIEMSSPLSTGSGEKEDTVPVLPEITFSDFDIGDGTYGYNKKNSKDFAITGSYKKGFANQTFVGTVNFTDEPATRIIFAGKESAWTGVSIVSRGDGNLSFVDANGQFPAVVIYAKLAKTTLTERDMEIGLTFEVTDLDNDGKKDDVRFWLTLDGVLYRNKPIVKAIDYAQYLGKMIGIYSDHEESNVKVASKDLNRPNNDQTLPTDFTEVAPNFFDIDDFKDNKEDPITYQGTQSPFTSADKVMLYTDVVFGNGRTIEYLYNGTTGSGIYLWAKENLHVRNYMSPSESAGMYIGGEFVNGEYKDGFLLSGRHDNYVIQASKYSTTENFDTLKVSLILTTEFVDFDGEGTANDLKLGVWINGKLYDNTYIYMRNCLDTYTPALKMNVVEMSSPISTGSGEKEDTVPVLPEITFSDFDIDDGTYGYNKEKPKDFAITGSYKEGFANQTFVGTVNFTDQPATCIGFAGKTSAWQGVRITSRGDGNLSFVDANGHFPTVVIYAKLAKTTLTERDMEIGLTFEVTDLDNDGKKDDVRFWLTLDGVLYRNKPIVKAIDYAQYLGKFMGIYSDHEASSVTIASKDIQRPVQEVDFSIMGFTKDWEKTLNSGSKNAMNGVSGNKAPYTADNTNYTNYITICILAFVMLGGACYIKGYGKKETD